VFGTDDETMPGGFAANALATCAVICATIEEMLAAPPEEACGTTYVEFG
jgi:hypothetical protein